LLVGDEVLRFEPLTAEEREPPPLVEHGVRLLGSPWRAPWGRLLQVGEAGATRDVWHLVHAEVVVGRSSGDITFPDDDRVSELHALLRHEDGRSQLEDAGSAAGTFVRIRGERVLQPGDQLRLGEHHLRFET
jgi:hypothetical protein